MRYLGKVRSLIERELKITVILKKWLAGYVKAARKALILYKRGAGWVWYADEGGVGRWWSRAVIGSRLVAWQRTLSLHIHPYHDLRSKTYQGSRIPIIVSNYSLLQFNKHAYSWCIPDKRLSIGFKRFIFVVARWLWNVRAGLIFTFRINVGI